MTNVIDQLMDILNANQADPLTFLVFLFLLTVAAAIILPIPIELGLLFNPGMFFPIKAIDIGLGKAVGAVAVFYIPSALRAFGRWLRRKPFVKRIMAASRTATRKTGISRATKRIRGRRRRPAEANGTPAMPRWRWLRWLAEKSEKFTRKHGVLAMYAIMSVPGMLDTIPLYVFSIINKDRTLIKLHDFALANFLAGINRSFIIFALLDILGISLI